MSEPYLSQIILLPFNWAPKMYSRCDGAILTAQQNAALYSLLGNTFGGSSGVTFALPDLRGRAAVHDNYSNITIGTSDGFETVTLDETEIPMHTHDFMASVDAGTKAGAANNVFASARNFDGTEFPLYVDASNIIRMNIDNCNPAGGDQPHNNMQPSIVMNFCIAVAGTYPPRN